MKPIVKNGPIDRANKAAERDLQDLREIVAMCGEKKALDDAMTPAELKALRAELDISQAELAKRLGVSVTTVSRWECGRHKIDEQKMEADLTITETRGRLRIGGRA